MPTHQLDPLDLADLMDYYLQNPADLDVTDPDQTDPEADIESDQEAYYIDLESDPEVGELLPAPCRIIRTDINRRLYRTFWSMIEADLKVGESLPARADNLQPLMKPQQQSISSPEKMGMLFQSDVPKSIKKGISTRSTFNATVGGHFGHR